MDFEAILGQLMELAGPLIQACVQICMQIVQSITSSLGEGGGLKAGAAATLIGGAALTGALPPGTTQDTPLAPNTPPAVAAAPLTPPAQGQIIPAGNTLTTPPVGQQSDQTIGLLGEGQQ